MKKNKIVLIVFIIALTLFFLSFFRIDPDYLWHVKAGEYMAKHGLLKNDVFSWSVSSKAWMSHEWLFEIIIYGLKCIFGKMHLFIYCFSCIFILLMIIFHGNRKNIYNNLFFTIIWFVCSIIMVFVIQGRPHLISNCLLAFSFYFLYDLYKNENSKKIYFLPFISILWANIHGGSSNLPYLLCILFIVAGSFKFNFNKIVAKRLTKKQYLKYFITMLVCMVCVCINLHGVRMLLYPYQNMLDQTMLMNISEWMPTSLNNPTHYCYFILLIFIVCIFLFSKKKIEFIDFILFAFCVYLGLKSIRFWPYTYIIMSFIVFSYITKKNDEKGIIGCILFISCLWTIMFLIRGNHIFNVSYQYVLNYKDIQMIKKENPKKMFNMYDYGGDLIYNDILVFIDGRADLYGKYNYKDYLTISNLKGDYVSAIHKYDFDYFLIDKKYPIATYLKYNDEYELIYLNKEVMLYKKRTV